MVGYFRDSVDSSGRALLFYTLNATIQRPSLYINPFPRRVAKLNESTVDSPRVDGKYTTNMIICIYTFSLWQNIISQENNYKLIHIILLEPIY